MYLHTSALVLNSEPLAEQDRLVTLYTEKVGKIRAVCKGARRLVSKINPHVQVGREITAVLTQGREWWRLTSAQLETPASASVDFASNWQTLEWYRFWGRVLKDEAAEPGVWQILRELQQEISASGGASELSRLAATLRLIRELGYAPRFQGCAICGDKILEEAKIFYAWQSGVVCKKCPKGEGVNLPLAVPKLCRYLAETPDREWRGKRLPETAREPLTTFLNNFLRYHFNEAYGSQFFIKENI